ncbi:SAF domain-containing protein [Atopobiaceae bacterium 24-176]
MSKRFRIVFAGAFAVLALLCAVAYGEQVREQSEARRSEALERYGGEVAQVVVATEAVPAGDELGAANCALEEWLVDLVPEGALTSLDDVSGVPAVSSLTRGMPVCDVHVAQGPESVAVPSGAVAVTVPVGERTGVPAEVGAGTRLAAFRCLDGATRLLSPDVSVLAASGRQGGREGSLTLAVPSDDVAPMVTASADGTLRLVQPADDVDDLSASAAASAVAPQTGAETNENAPSGA